MVSLPKIKSYVWHGDECFFVSTIELDSSAAISPSPRYFETMAWEYDYATQERGESVAFEGDGPALAQHFRVCEQLYRTGKCGAE